MKHFFDILGAEISKLICKKTFLSGLLILLVLGGGMLYGTLAYPNVWESDIILGFYGSFAQIFILFYASKSLGEEFDLKTTTMLFTSKCSRSKIISVKLLSATICGSFFGIVVGILYDISLLLGKNTYTAQMLLRKPVEMFFVYAFFTFAAVALALFLTFIFHNTVTTFVSMIVVYMMFPSMIEMAGKKIAVLKNVQNFLACCISDDYVCYAQDIAKTGAILAVNGVLVYLATILFARKRDLR